MNNKINSQLKKELDFLSFINARNVYSNEVRTVLIDGVSYPAVLTDIKLVHVAEKGVKALRFRYRIYVNYSHVKEIEKDFYMYDVVPLYRNRTIDKLRKYLALYGLTLMDRDYENNFMLVEACKWLVGTKVEIKQRNYKDEKRYTLITTERTNYSRVNGLWEAMLKNELSTYPEYKQNSIPVLDEYVWYKY